VHFREREFVDVVDFTLQVAWMPTSLRGKHVLVVDDDPDIVDLIKFVVLQAGATVRTATGATEALNLLVESEWVPDVVLLDIGMPDMNGYELLLAIRRQDGIQSVPAVASPDSATTSTRIAPSTWGFRYTSRSHSSRTCWSISSGGSPKRGLPPSVDPWPGRFVPLDPLSQEGGRGFVSHPTGITPLGHVHEVSWGVAMQVHGTGHELQRHAGERRTSDHEATSRGHEAS
jgi:CheY-like chemotaxis protein